MPRRRSLLGRPDPVLKLEGVVEQFAHPDGETVVAAVGPDGRLVDDVGEPRLFDTGDES